MTKLETRSLKPKKKPEDDEESDGPKKKEKTSVRLLEMFRFASRLDKFYIFLAIICSLVNGLSFPLGALIFSQTVDKFMDAFRLDDFLDAHRPFLRDNNLTRKDVLDDPSVLKGKCELLDDLHNITNYCGILQLDDPLSEELEEYVYMFLCVGFLIFVSSLGQNTFWKVSAERQGNRIRREFLTNILRQHIGWFDARNVGELNVHLSADIVQIQNGIGESVGTTIQFLSSFFFGYVIGFIRGWQLALILVAFSPLMILAGGFFNYLVVKIAAKETSAYAKAGAIAEEILSSIRTVVAYSGEEKGRGKYENNLGDAHKCGIQKGAATGAVIGFYGCINFTMYAIGMWFAGKFVRHDDLDIDEALVAFFAVSLGTFSLGIAGPGLQAISEARGAAFTVFQIIDTKSQIDSSSDKGLKPSSISGKIQFRDVHFSYPTRTDAKILNGTNIEVRPGQTVAIVGSSGCGKSTLIQLLLRFYDPQRGQVLLDGIDIKKLNIKYLRQLIGLVSQEPILFGTTIAENIRYGRAGVTTEEINQAAKNANAYDFIADMPDKFNTIVGERGAQLSGGQKQRIAIARTLVRDPKILLLDEATSALDNESEAIVQDALDTARRGRTTIIIAHRLSTIRTADIIIGLDQGVVKETGTHDELMAKRGIYYTLVTNQTKALEEEESSEEEEVKKEEQIERKRLMSIGEIGEDIQEIDEELPVVGFLKLLRANLPEWPFLFLGCVSSIVHGSTQPAFAFVFGRILKVFSKEDEEMKDDLEKYCLILLLIGAATFIGAFLQSYLLAIAGEAMTSRLRSQTFRAMLRQEIGWYDKPYNSTGALTNRLAKDACLVQGATGTKLGVLVQCFVAIVGAIVLAFVYGWQLTLMAVSFFPFLLGGGIMQVKLLSGNVGLAKEANEAAAKVAVEVLENVRTVASLSKEQDFINKYMFSFDDLLKIVYKRCLVFGFFFALSNASVHVTAAVVFAYGGYLVDRDTTSAEDVLKVFTFLIFCGVYLGQSAGFSPDIGKATAAAQRIFYVMQRKSRINAELTSGSKPNKATFKSTIEFSNTVFSYPLRPNVKVLQKFNLIVKPGQTVALVGSSGCGKSTCISLLERFYNIDGGSVSVGNNKLEDLNIRWLRYQIGLVSQEPVLFDLSIAENIAYGDNSRQITMDEIVRAAKKSNIHNFVTALPHGYDTNVGDKGTQLSGGQKQRIAIARALVRDPKILLLDEATSALDTESEAIVQEALDKAREGRTCITIAHRLSTIRDAHKIVVVKHGQVVEDGTHEELMALRGAYYRLQNAQSKG